MGYYNLALPGWIEEYRNRPGPYTIIYDDCSVIFHK